MLLELGMEVGYHYNVELLFVTTLELVDCKVMTK